MRPSAIARKCRLQYPLGRGRQGPLFRGALAICIPLLFQGVLLGQTVTRVAPVVIPSAAASVPAIPRASFLKNISVSGALSWNSLQQPAVAPSGSDLRLAPSLPSTDFDAQVPAGVPVVEVGGAPLAAAPGAPETRSQDALPSSLPDQLGQTPSQISKNLPSGLAEERRIDGRSDFKHSKAARAMEAELSAIGAIFDGSRVRTQAEIDGLVPSGNTQSSKTGQLPETAGLSGRALVDSAHEISGRGFRVKGYDEARDYMYSVADHVEHQGRSGILDAYSGTFLQGQGGDGGRYGEPGDANGDGYKDRGVNAEHIWPQSFFDRALPMRSDLHHLMATLEHPNSIRSNFPFGVVTDPHPEYSNKGGAKMSRGIFEPPDFTKGRVARAAFYFYARYNDRRIYMGPGARFWSRGMIETLLRWNREFPPSQFEKDRNDLVERWQGNRNPFIDDPGMADRIGVDAFLGPKGGGVSRFQLAPAEVQGRDKLHALAVIQTDPSSRDDLVLNRGNDGSGGDLNRKHGKRWEKRHKDRSRRNRSYSGR
ncbi:MAG: endonuclease [Elusimicrobia bacterium]|nr:endonuclease [Elusimicrobiota bacterium]